MAKETGWQKAAKASKGRQAAAKTLSKARDKLRSNMKKTPGNFRAGARETKKYMKTAVAVTKINKKFGFATGPGTGRNSRHGGAG